MIVRKPTLDTDAPTKVTKDSQHVDDVKIWEGNPVELVPMSDEVSRWVKGKYVDVPYSSEDLIRDKRAEVELEER